MRTKFSLELTKKYGEPTWLVSEDDRSVTHEIPISALCHRPAVDGEPSHGDIAKNSLVNWLAEHLKQDELHKAIEGDPSVVPGDPAPEDVDVGGDRDEVDRRLELLRQADKIQPDDGSTSHVQWLLIRLIMAASAEKPNDRMNPIDRHYAIFLTDLEKALSWARDRTL